MHKKDALDADRLPSNGMEKQPRKNNGFNACAATEPSSGRRGITVWRNASTGLGYGLPRVVPSDCSARFLVTVPLISTGSRITGLNKLQRRILITPISNMLFMTRPIFTKMAAY